MTVAIFSRRSLITRWTASAVQQILGRAAAPGARNEQPTTERNMSNRSCGAVLEQPGSALAPDQPPCQGAAFFLGQGWQ
jgi:hypothetical protein